MRFDELTLERYGAFESRAMRFGPGLTVVYGANEAGKSTSLSAVGDFLFGVPDRSLRGAVFGNEALRIGAALTRSDGSQLTLKRRKGRVRTLTDADGAAVEETALAALLGSTTRERFDTLFGLNHEELRKGGERLLKADGEIGRLIVEAGGGLRSLVARLDAIDQTLDALYKPRAEKPAFNVAVKAHEAADKDVKAGLLTREAYERSKTAHGEAEAEAARLVTARRALSLDLSTLERTAHVMPMLRALDAAEAEFAAIDAPVLAETFDVEAAAAAGALAASEAALAAARTTSDSLAARLDAIAIDERLIVAEAAIRDAVERATHLAKQRDDRPNRLKEYAETSAKLEGLRRRLGLSAADDLGRRLPAEEAVRAVGGLAAAAQRRIPALAAAARSIAETEAEIAALDARIAAERAAGRGDPTGVSVAELASLPSAMALASVRRAEGVKAASTAADAARALRFGSVAALERLSCPDADWIARSIAREEAAETERLRQLTLRADAEARRQAAEDEIARLSVGGEVASETSLAAARSARATAWEPIRTAHVAGDAHQDAAVRRREAETLDAALSSADDIADRRAAEAGRAAALAQAERANADARSAAGAAERALAGIAAAAAATRAELDAGFPDAIVRAPSLAALKTLTERRREALRAAETAAATLRDADIADAQLAGSLDALTFAEAACGLAPCERIDQRVRAVISAVERRNAAHALHLQDVAAREKAAIRLASERRALAGLMEEDDNWRDAWGPAVARLGLDATAPPDDAAAAAIEWSGARGVMTALDLIRDRIGKMDRDEADLADRVAAVGEATGIAVSEDVIAAARMLYAHFAENDARRRDRETLAPDMREAELRLTRAHADAVERRGAIALLAEAAGVAADDAAGLARVAGRHAERRGLAQEIARLTRDLADAGDGRSLSELRAAAAGRDPDQIKADAEAKRAEVERVQHECDAAIRVEHDARVALDALDGQASVNRAVVLRESATAELHEIVERYVELSLARDLVEAAIARVRAEQQDPLVTRAGALFSQVTRKEFSGVGTDVDDKGEPVVVGVRAKGGEVHASAMSDGTRDQLFLAFRLASLEAYCAAAEPLPFVADDVLVHFDDARSRATLELLADFASVTQVLLFTHHLSVRRMAEELGSERCGIGELG